MRLLLESKVLLWALQDYSSLGIGVRLQMKHADAIYVSAASIWEIRVKDEAGKVVLPSGFMKAVAESGFSELAVSWEAADAAREIELDEGDGFDRVLLAQASQEQLILVTSDDELLKAYPELCLDART